VYLLFSLSHEHTRRFELATIDSAGQFWPANYVTCNQRRAAMNARCPRDSAHNNQSVSLQPSCTAVSRHSCRWQHQQLQQRVTIRRSRRQHSITECSVSESETRRSLIPGNTPTNNTHCR